MTQTSFFTTVPEGPKIEPVISLPFPLADPIPSLNDVTHATIEDPKYIDPYLHDPLPEECLPKGLDPAATIRDPTEVLRAQITGQNFVDTDVIAISTAAPGGIVNIPFVVKNANASQMDAIFWIERVSRPDYDGRLADFLQLQYVQRVILDFLDIHWPHVSVATLVKSA